MLIKLTIIDLCSVSEPTSMNLQYDTVPDSRMTPELMILNIYLQFHISLRWYWVK